ncbi:MAG: hypothetical protein LUQ71_02285 [Methanoregula sp.]|nr:hypothetical protein [Methanoregula sp.]
MVLRQTAVIAEGQAAPVTGDRHPVQFPPAVPADFEVRFMVVLVKP